MHKSSKPSFQKRRQFGVSIRRQQREKYFKQLRKKYFQSKSQIKAEDVIDSFQLRSSSKFCEQALRKKSDFIWVQILLAKEQNLIRVTFRKNQMLDEELLPPINSELQLQQLQLPRQYPFYLQSCLYDNISKDIYKNPGKYKNMDQEKQQGLIHFWIKFMKRNRYTETARQKDYHRAIINLLELFVLQIQSPDLRQMIFRWVEGTEALTLIFNCLPGPFMDCNQYSKIYDIVLKGLRQKKVEKKMEAVDVLMKCIRQSDYDDILSILQQKSTLFTQLLLYFQNQTLRKQMHDNQDYLNSLKKAAFCVCIFLQTYDETIVDCVREGAGYVGALLICQSNVDLIISGLMIFNHIANVEESYCSKQVFQFLLSDYSIKDTGAWKKLGNTYQIVRHQRIEVKRQFTTFILNFLAHASYKQIVEFGYIFQYENDQDLVDMLISMFLDNEDSQVMESCLNSLLSLSFYANATCEDQTESAQMKQNQQNTQDTLKQNIILYKIKESLMLKKLQQIDNQDKGEYGYSQGVKKVVQDLLQHLQRANVKRKQNQI